MGQIHKPSTDQLSSNTESCYGRDTFLSSLQKRPKPTLTPTSEPMQYFLVEAESGRLNLENHHLTLAIAKKILDKNHFKNAQKTTDRKPPSFQLGDRVYFKNKQPGNWDLKSRPGYKIVHIKHERHHLHIENQATGKTRSCNIKDIVCEPPIEFWNIDTQFGRAGKYINHPANLPTIKL